MLIEIAVIVAVVYLLTRRFAEVSLTLKPRRSERRRPLLRSIATDAVNRLKRRG